MEGRDIIYHQLIFHQNAEGGAWTSFIWSELGTDIGNSEQSIDDDQISL